MRLLRAIVSGIGITLMVAIVTSFVLWFLGGYLGFGSARPFEGLTGRLVGLAVLWVLALIVILVILLRHSRKDEAMADEIVTSAEPASLPDEALSAELTEMRDKLRAALAALRRSKAGRRHLYDLPWYILIGPPGAGKTTAIVNSGLSFPLADESGKSAVGGVGGTRNCDWWFTDSAVVVDTAGRYTTQESDAGADNAAWLGFLSILKRHRPRQPINGALVAISLSDLSLQDEATQKAHAAAIRRRLNELRERLGVRFPVYVLFTKADLLAGFTEFFDDLGKEERGQVWGFTLPLDTSGGLEAFDGEYAVLLRRLNEQSLGRIQDETDPARRSLIAGFASQVASVQQTARAFLGELFQENRYEHRHLLRGVYFTSGTQEGTPIDRLMLGMSRTFGIGRQAIGSGQGSGRSYFLTRLFSGVIFPESGLVSADDKVERRYRWSRRAAIAATVVLTLALGSTWARSYMGNRALAAETTARVAAYREAAAQIPSSPVGDTDLPGVVPPLDLLRSLPGNPAAGDSGPPPGLGWGLYQGDVIGTEAAQAYRAALNRHLLPRLLLRLEEQMQASTSEPDYLYEALKVYLMLGLAGPMNAGLVRDWMEVDWELAYPGPAREQLRADLAAHLDAMLSAPMRAIALNADLVAKVRGVLADTPPAERVYAGILASPAAAALPQFRLTDEGGPAIARAIVRSSGDDLSDGIAGIYTRKGFHDVFLDEALGVAERIQRDAWVLGPASAAAEGEAGLAALSRDVLNLYYDDYVKTYDALLGDIDIIPMESPSHAAEVTNVLSGPTSPIAAILQAVAEETRLTRPPDPGVVDAAGALEGAAAVAQQAAQRQLSPALQKILAAGSPASAEVEVPGAYVEARFRWLHDFVGAGDGQPSQLDAMVALLRDVYQELSNIAGGLGQGDVAALTRFRQQAQALPGPMGRWATQIADGSSGISADSTRTGINGRWQSNVLPFCQQATTGAYPFDKRAQAEISLQDFTSLFGPGGKFDAFFAENLAEHVDTRTRPWSWKKVAASELGISDAVLAQFQNAAAIRDAFFPAGGEPKVSFQLTPDALDPGVQQAEVEIDGQLVGFRHGIQPRPISISWPGPVGTARVSFAPPLPGSESSLTRNGPWAWFRLLDTAQIRRTPIADRKRVVFKVGGRFVMFEMQAGSVINPFSLSALTEFRCPETF